MDEEEIACAIGYCDDAVAGVVGDLLGACRGGQEVAGGEACAEQEEDASGGKRDDSAQGGAAIDEEHGGAEEQRIGDGIRAHQRQQQDAGGEERIVAGAGERKDAEAEHEGEQRSLHAGVAHDQRDGPAGGEQPYDALLGRVLAEGAREKPAGGGDGERSEDLHADDYVTAGEQIDGGHDKRIEQAGGAGEVLVEVEGEVAVFREVAGGAQGNVGVLLQRVEEQEGNADENDQREDEPGCPAAESGCAALGFRVRGSWRADGGGRSHAVARGPLCLRCEPVRACLSIEESYVPLGSLCCCSCSDLSSRSSSSIWSSRSMAAKRSSSSASLRFVPVSATRRACWARPSAVA